MRKKLVLAVIDSLKPEMLDQTVAAGQAPVLATLIERGTYARDCVSTFPSLTPVCAATISTGLAPDRHLIPSTNWYHRGEERYVEYGSSFLASSQFGIVGQLFDTVYNLNMAHLTRAERTVFEHLDDAGLRTAGTTYLIYRGRTRHETADNSLYPRLARAAAQLRHAVWGPGELFYADLFASRESECRSVLGRPGMRDQHGGCVGAQLVEDDLFDFLLLSLPDNDAYSHKHGPYAQMASIARADNALERTMNAAGGIDAFLDEHAVVVVSDHSQTAVDERIFLADMLADWRVLAPAGRGPAEVALCPVGRFAGLYALDPDDVGIRARLARRLEGREGLDLVVRRDGDEAVVHSARGELRFAPGGDLDDGRGTAWSVEGEPAALELAIEAGRVRSPTYPDALRRLWAALECRHSGDVLISATPGYEFADWGGVAHLGGGSHGSLHRGDSLGVLIACGVEARPPKEVGSSIEDVTPLVREHFSLAS